MSDKQDDIQQLSFDFFPESGEDKNAPAEKELFDSEEDALDSIITASGQDDDQADPWPQPDPDAFPCGAAPAEVKKETAETAEAKKKAASPLPLRMLRRLALGFLASGRPDGLACSVRGLLPHMTVDAVSFHLSGAACEIRKTALVLAAEDPAQWLMPRARREKMERELAVQLAKKAELEAKIRETEPELNASLFEETAVWEYEKSRMAKYHRCLRKIETLKHELHFSGKLERVIAEKAADENYILFPEGTRIPDGLPPQWGILSVSKDRQIRMERPSEFLDVSPEARLRLALLAAASSCGDTLFANGIAAGPDGTTGYCALPRRRPVLFRTGRIL